MAKSITPAGLEVETTRTRGTFFDGPGFTVAVDGQSMIITAELPLTLLPLLLDLADHPAVRALGATVAAASADAAKLAA